MMREIVVDGDAAHRAAHLQPPLHAAERGERREACATGTPAWRAAAIAASAFNWLWRPSIAEAQRALRRAAELDRAVDGDRPAGAGARDLGGAEALDLAPAAARQHARRLASPPLTMSRPLPRHRAHRWWNCVSIAARSGKMSA